MTGLVRMWLEKRLGLAREMNWKRPQKNESNQDKVDCYYKSKKKLKFCTVVEKLVGKMQKIALV